jgi:hypothetical protein
MRPESQSASVVLFGVGNECLQNGEWEQWFHVSAFLLSMPRGAFLMRGTCMVCLRIRAAYSNRVMIPAARPTPHRVPAGLKARRHVGDTRLCLRETQVYGSMP